MAPPASSSHGSKLKTKLSSWYKRFKASKIGKVMELPTKPMKSAGWWFDSGAGVHVCYDKTQFKNYKEIKYARRRVRMGNGSTAKVVGIGNIELVFTPGKKYVLANVWYVPEVRINLISAYWLCKDGIKAVLEDDKLILTKNGVFVGKGYSCNQIYKLSLDEINSPSGYTVESIL